MPNGMCLDDKTIEDNDTLWRRVKINADQIVFDANLNRWRPTSGAFSEPSDGSSMSVGIASVAIENNRGPQDMITGYADCAIAGIAVALVRKHRQSVIRKPLVESPEHGEVVGKKTKSIKSALAKGSIWVIEPPSSSTL